MKRFMDFFYKIIDIVMIIAFMVMVFAISTNVIFRYFGMALTWADEVSSMSFVWMSFLAITVGLKIGVHPTFMVFLEKANDKQGRIMHFTINILILIFLLYLFVGGYTFISRIAYQRTPILGISVAWKYSAVIFASFVMILDTIYRLFLIIKHGVVSPDKEAA